ncbi:MAG: hypothetical protein CMK89_12255 [Pseudomonadales bacterium]|nr:hypothetical protein [Pseudomonadales bacterium]
MNRTIQSLLLRSAFMTSVIFAIASISTHVSAAGLLKPVNQQYQDLIIESHHVDVVIADGYATTQIEQVFFNPNAMDLETIYSFPVPSKAAVGEFTYWIDGNPVTGEVLEKREAREVYNEQKSQGNEAALVEQDDYKTFDISVYPVRANDKVKIRLVYVQATHTDTGIGRYQYPLEEGGVDEAKQSFWTRNETVEQSFQFNLTLRSNYPIDGLRLPNQPNAVVNQLSSQEYQVSLSNLSNQASNQMINEGTLEGTKLSTENQTAFTLNQDIIAYWRYTPGLPGALDMVTYKATPEEKGTFLLTLTPAMDLQPLQQGRDWVFVLDISGSMQGKYSTLVEGVRQAMGKLTADDRFRVILFNDRTKELTHGYDAVTPENINRVLNKLDNITPNNGTNLYAGVEKALKNLDADRATGIILVTDGVANVGVTEKKDFLTLLEKADVRLFSFIMGNQSNRPLLEGMTKVSQGFYQEVSNADDILGQVLLATGKLNHEALRDIQIDIDGVRVKDLTPSDIGTLYRGQQLHIAGHYWKGGAADVRISGKIGGEKKVYETTIQFPETETRYPELERIWAYTAIEALLEQQDYLGESQDTKQAIIDIAKEYSLVTDYTSMIVVRDSVFEEKGIARSNQQRVENERLAREVRATQPVQNHRADTNKPLYTHSRPSVGSGGGGGSINGFILPMIAALYILRRRKRS